MGVYTDLLAAAKSWDSGVTPADGTVAGDRVITEQIEQFRTRQTDLDVPDAYAATDEIQEIGYNGVVTGGNSTLTITLRNGDTCTTANIAFDVLAAGIEDAINTAATGNITDWTNGDISVALTGNLTANDAVLTYDGASVNSVNQETAVLNDVDLTGNSTGTVVETAAGAAGTDEVQDLAAFAGLVNGGNFTITINLADEAPFTTANIAYNAVQAAIETAIDVAATTAAVTSWTNADISVALLGDLTANAATFTYDGASVDSTNQPELTVTDVDLAGGGTVGAVSTSVPGVAGTDEINTLAIFATGVSGGNYTLTINVTTDAAFDTANIAYGSNAAQIEAIIDTAATGNITAWANGAISVSGGPLTTTPLVLTFDGVSVDNADQTLTIVNDIDLTTDYAAATTVTTNGQTIRLALAALNVMGIVDGPPPAQGSYSGLVASGTRQSHPWFPRQETLKALAMQAGIEDGEDGMYVALMTLFGLERLL